MTEKEFIDLMGEEDYKTWREASDLLESGAIDYEEYEKRVGNWILVFSK